MEILKLLAENPGSGAVIAISVALFVFYCGATWVTISRMNKEMITKNDLSIALLQLKLELADVYVAKAECDLMERRKEDYRG